MISVPENKNLEKQQDSYPFNTNIYYRGDSISEERVKRFSHYDEANSLYFGNVYLGRSNQKGTSFYDTLEEWTKASAQLSNPLLGVTMRATGRGSYFGIERGFTRGTVQLVGSLAKAGVIGTQTAIDSIKDFYEANEYLPTMQSYKQLLDNGTWTKEEYDANVKQYTDSYLVKLKQDNEKINLERQQTIGLMKNIDSYTKSFINHLKIQRRDEENKGVSKWITDIEESAPTTLGYMGLLALTKNPALTATVMGAVSGLATMGETAQQALEKGATVRQAFGVSLLTGGVSGGIEGLGDAFLGKIWTAPSVEKFSKNAVMNKLQQFVAGNGKGTFSKAIGSAIKGGFVSSGEEGLTEGAQAVVEMGIPKLFGYGEEFEHWYDALSSIAYQAWIGALSGGLFGSMGTFIYTKRMHSGFKELARQNGASEAEQIAFADTMTDVFSQKGKEGVQLLVNEISTLDETKAGETVQAINTLLGGATEEENRQIRKNLENSLAIAQGQVDENGVAKPTAETKLGAAILDVTANLASRISGRSKQDIIQDIKIEVAENIDPSNKDNELFAKDKDGNIIGSASESSGKRIIRLAKGGDSIGIVHEASHLLMNVVAETYARYKQDPNNVTLSPIVMEIVNRFGEPKGSKTEGYFSEEQQERFASEMVRMIIDGEEITPALGSIAQEVRSTVHNIDNAMSTANLQDAETRKTFATIFAKEEAVLPDQDIDVNDKQKINEIRDVIKTIQKGGKPSLAQLKTVAQWIRFGNGASPYTIGYTFGDFLKEHGEEYSKKSINEKYDMLKRFGFNVDELSKTFPSREEFLKAMEELPEVVALDKDTEAKRVQQKKARFNAAASVWKEIFKGVDIDSLINSISELRKQGYAVIDSKTVAETVDTLNKLTKEFQESRNKNKKIQIKASENILRFANRVLENMELMGVNTEGMKRAIEELSNAKDNEKLAENLLERMRTVSDEIAIRYYNSDLFLEQEGIVPPTIDSKNLTGQITLAMLKAVNKGMFSDSFSVSKLMGEVSKVLKYNKIPTQVRNEILAKLGTKSFNQLTGAGNFAIIDEIIKGINNKYQKDMIKRINKLWSKLASATKKKNVNPKDYQALMWINKNIMKSGASAHELTKLDLDKPIGKDVDGNDVFFTFEQRELANNLLMLKTKEYKDNVELANQQLSKIYVDLFTLSNTTRSYPEHFENMERQRLADAVKKTIGTLQGRIALPKIAQFVDSLAFSGPLAGMRSNLISIFGQNFADVWDTIVQERQREIRRMSIFRNVRTYVENVTRGFADTYFSKIRSEKPFANAKVGTVQYLLKEYTRGQLLDIWLTSQQENGIESLSRVLGKGATTKEEKIKQTKNIIEEIEKTPSFNRFDKNFGLLMREYMKTLHRDISLTNTKINGKPMGFVENYWPFTVKQKVTGEVVNDMNFFVPTPETKKAPGFTLERVGLAEGQVLEAQDAFERFERYINNATKFIYLVSKLNDLSRIIADENVKDSIVSKYGEGMYTALQKDIQFNLGLEKHEKLTLGSKILKEISSNAIVGALGFKFWTALKQVPSFVNYAQNMPTGSFFGYVSEAITNPVKTWNYMMNNFASVRSRYNDSLPTTFGQDVSTYKEGLIGLFGENIVSSERASQKLSKVIGVASKLKQWAMTPTRWGDAWANVLGGYAYTKYLEQEIENSQELKKLSKEEKKLYVERKLIEAMETTQQSGFNTTKGSLQRTDSAFLKTFMAFSSANAQFVRKIREAWYKHRNGEISGEEFAKTFMIYGVVNPAIYAMMSAPALYIALVRGLLDGGDNEEYKEELYLSLVRPFVDNIFSAWGELGGMGTFVSDVVARKAGQKTYSLKTDLLPFFAEDFLQGIKKLTKTRNQTAEDVLDGILDMAQIVSPLPLQTTKKMIKGVKETFSESQLFYLGTILGIPEGQIDKLIKEIEK